MGSDIVERLREEAAPLYFVNASGVLINDECTNALRQPAREAADEITRLRAREAELVEALERIEPNIGWRGKPADDLDSDFFCCEFCGGQATDATDVPHHDECLVYVIRAAIARAKGQTP